ncbi:hypothetical protein CUT44_04325 [Streptomyces carminius]|uniref:Uncharacterized protein n=1 Tax=Streptomyces carminius TaxID=2665496 RepID=A0A2M8M6C0_9ACTN|nr:hypothetical protein [Streptomyces carminius]PJE99724.1 hypothetical protein CUT44_04325 [Streptomyces carminius]
MLRIVTPLTTLPLVLLALAEPAEEDRPEAPAGVLSHPGHGWRYTLAGGGPDDLYTVQVTCDRAVPDPPAGPGAERNAVPVTVGR